MTQGVNIKGVRRFVSLKKMYLPRLTIDEDSLNRSKDSLVKNNDFNKTEEEWNISETKNLRVMVKRKVSSEENIDADNKLVSNNTNATATFTFSTNDLKDSSKAADKLNSNASGGQFRQTDLFRFLAADPNFKSRKKLKLNQ